MTIPTDLSKITVKHLLKCEPGPWDHIQQHCRCIHCGAVMVDINDIRAKGYRIEPGPGERRK